MHADSSGPTAPQQSPFSTVVRDALTGYGPGLARGDSSENQQADYGFPRQELLLNLRLAAAVLRRHIRPARRLLNPILNPNFLGSRMRPVRARHPVWECERRLKIKNNGVQGDDFRSAGFRNFRNFERRAVLNGVEERRRNVSTDLLGWI